MRKWVSFVFVNATSKCFVGNLPVRCQNRVPYFIVPHYSLDTFKACIDLIKIYLLSLKKISVYLVVGKGPPTLSIEFSMASTEKPVTLVRLFVECSTIICTWCKNAAEERLPVRLEWSETVWWGLTEKNNNPNVTRLSDCDRHDGWRWKLVVRTKVKLNTARRWVPLSR